MISFLIYVYLLLSLYDRRFNHHHLSLTPLMVSSTVRPLAVMGHSEEHVSAWWEVTHFMVHYRSLSVLLSFLSLLALLQFLMFPIFKSVPLPSLRGHQPRTHFRWKRPRTCLLGGFSLSGGGSQGATPKSHCFVQFRSEEPASSVKPNMLLIVALYGWNSKTSPARNLYTFGKALRKAIKHSKYTPWGLAIGTELYVLVLLHTFHPRAALHKYCSPKI